MCTLLVILCTQITVKGAACNATRRYLHATPASAPRDARHVGTAFSTSLIAEGIQDLLFPLTHCRLRCQTQATP